MDVQISQRLLAFRGKPVPPAPDVAEPLPETYRFCGEVFDVTLRHVEMAFPGQEGLRCFESALEGPFSGRERFLFR
ncbi:hypothetical protein PUR32_15675 [Streptomyces sp. BE133]|nr:hypothetical protein [Streptomyces sp. BE133]MEE1807615.1 hypothetical protein [Streptomyces sp. BE133]